MDVKELRVGNLIYCKTDKGTKVGRIDSLQEISKIAFFVAVRTADGVDYKGKVNDEYNCIEPIPLTEKILLKNGFKEDRNGCYNYDDYNDSISIKIDLGYTFIEYAKLCFNPEDVTETEYGSSLEFPNTLHVHTLQNIWHLMTGKELEIKI